MMLNKHVYIGWTVDDPTPRQIVGIPSGWAFSDAVSMHWCPTCGSFAGFHCQGPKGRKVWPPHSARVAKLTPEQMEACTGKAIKPLSLFKDNLELVNERTNS